MNGAVQTENMFTGERTLAVMVCYEYEYTPITSVYQSYVGVMHSRMRSGTQNISLQANEVEYLLLCNIYIE